MARFRRMLLPVALTAALFHGLVLSGCGGGGGSSPTGSSAGAQLRLRFAGAAVSRSAVVGVRSASVGGANVSVDGVVVGVTDAGGEIVLNLAPGTHTIAVESGGVTSTPFEVTVAEGDVVTLDVELAKDGTLVVEQDKDHDGDYDDADDDDDEADDDDQGDEDDDDDDDDDEGGAGSHTDGTVTVR